MDHPKLGRFMMTQMPLRPTLTNFNTEEKEEFFNAPTVFYSTTNGGNYFSKFSESWCNLLGYTKDELTTTPFIHLIHPDDIQKTMTEFLSLSARARTSENVSQFTCRFLTKKGETVFLNWTSKVKPNGMIFSITQDITPLIQNNVIAGNFKSRDQLVEEFTETELKIFTLLARHEGECVTKEHLYSEIYGQVRVQDQTINVHISNLRKKIKGSAYTLKTAGKGRWKLLNKYQCVA